MTLKPFILAVLIGTAGLLPAQDTQQPSVTVKKMADDDFKRLNDASDAMQTAAEAYLKAADAYAATKNDVLGRYDGLEQTWNTCATTNPMRKIVDVRGQYVIVEYRREQGNMYCWRYISSTYTLPTAGGNPELK